MPKTRSETGSKVADYIGCGKEFSLSEIPTNRDVLCMGILMKEKKLLEDDVAMRNYPNKVLASDLAVNIIKQWYRANPKFQPPVTISKRALVMRIEKLWERLSSVVRGRVKKKFKDKFDYELDCLFEVTLCPHTIYLCNNPQSKCKVPKSCKEGAHINCDCPSRNKSPSTDILWLHRQ